MASDEPDSVKERILDYLEREGAAPVSRIAEALELPWEQATEHAMELEDSDRITAEYAAEEGLILRIRPEHPETGGGIEEAEHAVAGTADDGEHTPIAELQETVHELASRVEGMQQTLAVHQQRMDRVNASQAVFEREIVELMQDHRGVIADLRGRHRLTKRGIEMLFEALEEGVVETDATVREEISDIHDRVAVDHDGGTEALADELDLIGDKIERLEERKATAERMHANGGEHQAPAERFALLTDMIRETQERLKRLEQAMDDRPADSEGTPTVIE